MSRTGEAFCSLVWPSSLGLVDALAAADFCVGSDPDDVLPAAVSAPLMDVSGALVFALLNAGLPVSVVQTGVLDDAVRSFVAAVAAAALAAAEELY